MIKDPIAKIKRVKAPISLSMMKLFTKLLKWFYLLWYYYIKIQNFFRALPKCHLFCKISVFWNSRIYYTISMKNQPLIINAHKTWKLFLRMNQILLFRINIAWQNFVSFQHSAKISIEPDQYKLNILFRHRWQQMKLIGQLLIQCRDVLKIFISIFKKTEQLTHHFWNIWGARIRTFGNRFAKKFTKWSPALFCIEYQESVFWYFMLNKFIPIVIELKAIFFYIGMKTY